LCAGLRLLALQVAFSLLQMPTWHPHEATALALRHVPQPFTALQLPTSNRAKAELLLRDASFLKHVFSLMGSIFVFGRKF